MQSMAKRGSTLPVRRLRISQHIIRYACLGFMFGLSIGAVHDYFEDRYVVEADYVRYDDDMEFQSVNQSDFQTTKIAQNGSSLESQVRILCWILTDPKAHRSKAIHVKRTWGRRCNILLFMSSKNDSLLGSIALPVTEGRSYLWYKTKAAFEFVYENYRDQADWFLKADDDTFVVLENLRAFLSEQSSQKPIYFGCRFRPFARQGFMSGGAGYVLSHSALEALVVHGVKKRIPECAWSKDGAEDVGMG